MQKKKIKITNQLGINARHATSLVNVAMDYESNITLSSHKKNVDLKSIMGVMSLAVQYGAVVEITCDGANEEIAMDALIDKIIELKIGKEV